MKIKVECLEELNTLAFRLGFGICENYIIILNKNTLKKFTDQFIKNLNYPFYITPESFAINNGVPMVIGEWLEDGEVDLRL